MNKQITEDFKAKRKLFEALSERIENLSRELIASSGIAPFKIESRTKSVESFEDKVRRKNKYNDLNEVTDLAGIRIITFLESDVDKIAELIKAEFIVDKINSIDKRDLEINEFGYRSLHMVVSLNGRRERLHEYKRFKGLKFEIQIRSILQHAWAEIEHDIGYKGKTALPKSLRRSFNRLAALLESADIEFDRLKRSLDEYEEKIADEIKEKPDEVELNKPSLISFVKGNRKIEELDKKIAEILKGKFDPQIHTNITGQVVKLNLLGINTIDQLNKAYNENFVKITEFTNLFQQRTESPSSGGAFRAGISLHYLCYTLVTLPENIHLVEDLSMIIHGNNNEASENLAEERNRISSTLYAN